MRVEAINFGNYNKNFNQYKKNSVQKFNTNKNLKDSFIKNYNINFKSLYQPEPNIQSARKYYSSFYDDNLNFEWDIDNSYVHDLRIPYEVYILSGSEAYLQDLAREMCLYSDEDIRRFCEIRKKGAGRAPKDEQLSDKAYALFKPHIKRARQEVERLMKVKDEYDAIKAGDLIDEDKHKNTITEKLLNPVRMQGTNEVDVNIPNGIFMYGMADPVIENIYNWLKTKSGLRVRTVQYNPSNPKESIDGIRFSLNKAQQAYEADGDITLLDLKNFDDLLTKHHLSRNKVLIEEFNKVCEEASSKYHTILLLKTNKPVDRFDSSAIDRQRFDLPLKIDGSGITKHERREYEDSMSVLKETIDLNHRAFNEYTERYTLKEKVKDEPELTVYDIWNWW